MRFIIITLIIAVATLGVQLVLPWWSLALVAFVIGYLSNLNWLGAFGAGLLGAGGLWFAYALYLNMANESLLATKLGPMFFGLQPLLLVLLSALIAGLVGGFATLGGRNLKGLLAKGE